MKKPIKVYINGKQRAEVKDGKLVFLKGCYDLNPFLDQAIPCLRSKPGKNGITFFVRAKPQVWKKLIYLDSIGFDIKGEA